MGNYFGRKKEADPSDPTQDAFYGVEVKKAKRMPVFQTVYRPHIFIDFYKSKLFKVNAAKLCNSVTFDIKFFVQCLAP